MLTPTLISIPLTFQTGFVAFYAALSERLHHRQAPAVRTLHGEVEWVHLQDRWRWLHTAEEGQERRTCSTGLLWSFRQGCSQAHHFAWGCPPLQACHQRDPADRTTHQGPNSVIGWRKRYLCDYIHEMGYWKHVCAYIFTFPLSLIFVSVSLSC